MTQAPSFAHARPPGNLLLPLPLLPLPVLPMPLPLPLLLLPLLPLLALLPTLPLPSLLPRLTLLSLQSLRPRRSAVLRQPRRQPRRLRWLTALTALAAAIVQLPPAQAASMTASRQLALREEARQMFRHGWQSYWEIAFPEDEVKPLSCVPHHRDRANPRDIGTNDALGDFSLTAIDALSTLAVMAASSEADAQRFWTAVHELVRIYWYNEPKDGNRSRTSAWGRFQGRAPGTRGFDIDAKVQVFETTIRGLGGLLSAHLFATQALPGLPGRPAYGGELLLLATDLGRRLLPALTLSPTGIPYPRINLRHGLPHGVKNPAYYNRPPRPARGRGRGRAGSENGDDDDDDNDDAAREHASQKHWRHATAAPETPDEETTETCTAGAGSLVLEFTTLARLTGQAVFERAARDAFDAIWRRRSAIGLVGAGVDAESGAWTGANAGVGAGADSFFEYAFKGYVLLAGHAADEAYYLAVWEAARAALQRHVLVREPAAWWTNVHVSTGARLAGGAWLDSLGSFWAGTLAGAGATAALPDALELAVRGHLVYTALWARYGALPERWSPRAGAIEGGLTWYPGRPELAESTYQLFRATRDPFWLHVGEMVLRDLVRRCRAGCGWAGLQDVRTGARQDRMESFWLSETWKYLFLLFDDAHPLHRLDAPWVFSTEGHPLILPRAAPSAARAAAAAVPPRTCAMPPAATGFFSPVASRPDLFHAAVLARLHEHPPPGPASPYYPATLPLHLVPPNATCAPVPSRDALDLIFPDGYAGPGAVAVSTLLSRFAPRIQRVADGVRILSLDALRLRLTAAVAAPAAPAAAAAAAAPVHAFANDDGDDDDGAHGHMRISKVAGVHLGREETVYIDRALIAGIRDENFAVFARDEVVDLLLTLSLPRSSSPLLALSLSPSRGPGDGGGTDTGYLHDMLAKLHDLLSLDSDSHPSSTTTTTTTTTTTATTTAAGSHVGITIQAVISHGRGAFPPVDIPAGAVYVADSQACAGILPRRAGAAPVVVLRRGGCTFAEKISHVPDSPVVRLVVVEDYPGAAAGQVPRVDGQQLNAWGRPRNNPVPLVMVPGRGGGGVDWAKVAEVAVRTRVGVRVMGREVRGLDVT